MHLVRAAALSGFDQLMTSYGLDYQELMNNTAVPSWALEEEHANNYLALNSLENLYAVAEKQSSEPALALILGLKQELPTLLGVLGFVMQQAKTVGEALYELEHYFSFQMQGAFIHLHMQDDYVALGLVVKNAAQLDSIRYTSEFAMGAGISILESLCGPKWRPLEIQFIHSAPKKYQKFSQILKAPVFFEQAQSAIIFKASDLAIEIAHANPLLKTQVEMYLKQLEMQFTDDPINQIEKLIEHALSSGSCNADKVAAFLGMHRRSLHRMLLRLDTSYTELYEKVSKDIAYRMLKQSNISITVIANMLCYSELSAFSRAFRKWTGMSPQKFRASV